MILTKKDGRGRRYYRCRLCGRTWKDISNFARLCCDEYPKRITDAEARERIEGRPFKGTHKLVGVLQRREDRARPRR